MIRILVVDDHPVIRKGIKQIIEETSDIVVEDEAENGYEVLEKVQAKEYNVILLDLSIPGITGLDVLKQLMSIKSNIRVLVLSMYPEDQYAVRVLKAGASGYLNKESAPEELIKAIQKINNGGNYISSQLSEKLLLDFTNETEKMFHETLSDREFQVMCMIASGKTVSKIAEDLLLSVKTVSTYRNRLLRKMKMNSNAELTHYAFKNNLIE